jgi:hypothetical protein
MLFVQNNGMQHVKTISLSNSFCCFLLGCPKQWMLAHLYLRVFSHWAANFRNSMCQPTTTNCRRTSEESPPMASNVPSFVEADTASTRILKVGMQLTWPLMEYSHTGKWQITSYTRINTNYYLPTLCPLGYSRVVEVLSLMFWVCWERSFPVGKIGKFSPGPLKHKIKNFTSCSKLCLLGFCPRYS